MQVGPPVEGPFGGGTTVDNETHPFFFISYAIF